MIKVLLVVGFCFYVNAISARYNKNTALINISRVKGLNKVLRKFDMHMHLSSHRDQYGTKLSKFSGYIKKALGLPGVEGGFFISPTYVYDDVQPYPAYYLGEETLALRGPGETSKFVTIEDIKRINSAASKALMNFPGKAHGLCGLNHQNSKIIQIAEDCLNMKGFVGVKFRGLVLHKDNKNGKIYQERFKSILKIIANSGGGVVLAHMGSGQAAGKNDGWNEDSQVGSKEEVELLISIMKDYTNVNIVIAHSGIDSFIGLDGLKLIGDYYKNNSSIKRNIYVEKSYSEVMIGNSHQHERAEIWGSKEASDLVSAWRDFDLNYVLFGSDSPHEEYLKIQESHLLNSQEKEDIQFNNIQRIIK